jgi:hypothetical protein
VSTPLTERKPRPPLTIRSGARPFQIMVLLGGCLAGAVGVFNVEGRSRIIIIAFGDATLYWYSSLLLWCGLALGAITPQVAGAVRRGWSTVVHPRGEEGLAICLRLEQAGLLGFSGTAFAWGIAALTSTGASALTAAIWIGLFGGASLWRAAEIHIDLRKLARARNNPQPAYPIPLGDPGRRS